MISLGPRIIDDTYRGLNRWSPHYPLLWANAQFINPGYIRSMWDKDYAYVLGVL